MYRKCKACKKKLGKGEFNLSNNNWAYCKTVECSMKVYDLLLEREKKAEEKKFRAETRRRKEAIMTVSDWTKKVQVKFNAYIRERDKGLPCISCSRMDHEITELGRPGGNWDAGHYRSRGASPELRFEPLNCHRQCKSCNGGAGQYTRKDHTVQKESVLKK